MKIRALLVGLVGTCVSQALADDPPLVLRGFYQWQSDTNYYSSSVTGNPGWPDDKCWNTFGIQSESMRGKFFVHPGAAPNGSYSLGLNGSNFVVTVTNGAVTPATNGTPANWSWNQADASFNQGGAASPFWAPNGIVAYQSYMEGVTLNYHNRYGHYAQPFKNSELMTTITASSVQAGTVFIGNKLIGRTAVATTPVQYSGKTIGDWWLDPAGAGVGNLESAGAAAHDDATKVGDPVDAVTGAHLLHESPIQVMGSTDPVSLNLVYNSKATASGGFAAGWSHNFEARVTASTTARVEIAWSHFETVSYYVSSVTGKFVAPSDAHQREVVSRDSATGTVTVQFDPTHITTFAASGLLSALQSGPMSLSVTPTTFTHSVAGTRVLPSRVTDSTTGVYLDFAYVSGPDAYHPSTVTSSDGRVAQFTYDTSGRLTRVTAANGQWMDFTLLASSTSPRIYAAYRSDGTKIYENTFDSSGRILTQKDGRNNTMTMAYHDSDLTNRYTDVTDRLGHTHRYYYDSNLRLSQWQNGTYSVTLGYNARGFRTTATDSLSVASSVAFTPTGDITSATATGATQTATYDSAGRLLTYTTPQGGQYTVGYNTASDVSDITDPNGALTHITYLSSTHLPATITTPAGGVTSITWTQGRATSTIDPAGNTTSIAYNGMGLPATITNAKGGVTSFLYDGAGQVLQTTFADQTQVSATYNANGKLATSTDQINNTTSFTYDSNANLIGRTNALTQTTTYEYNAENQLTARVTPLGARWTIAYDAMGNMSSTTDPTGVVTTIVRDSGGRVTGLKDGKGVQQITYGYDSAGRVTSSTDKNGAASTFQYNAQGDISQITDPLGRATVPSHDTLGRITAFLQPTALSTSQQYDSQGNVASFHNAAGQVTTVDHFVDNLTSAVTTATGKQTAYTYDSLNLLNGVVFPSGATLALINNSLAQRTDATDAVGHIQYSYDLRGLVTTVTEGAKTLMREYDALGRMSAYIDGSGKRVEYTYDADGRLSTLKYPGGRIVTYTYDSAARIKTVTDWAGRVTSYAYDTNGLLVTTANQNGTTETRVYSPDQSLQSLSDTSGSTVIYSNTFSYDQIGRLSSETKSPNVANSPTELPTSMMFDVDNRLTNFNGTAAGFDDDGNMVSGPNGTSPQSTGTYVYDARRRLTAAGGLNYGYDAENRRTTINAFTGTTAMTYDPRPVLNRVLVRTAPDGTPTYCVWGVGLIGEETGGMFSTFHYDRVGSTVAVTSQGGAVIGRIGYSPFGAISFQDEAVVTPFLFCGRHGVETDANRLSYMRARFYNPQTRRFLNEDVLLGSVSQPGSLNRYTYCSNNPIGAVDPLGREQVDVRLRAFIPPSSIAGYRGDNRDFSTDLDASSRVSVAVRIETDPTKNAGQPMIGAPQVVVGTTHRDSDGLEATSNGPMWPKVSVSQSKSGVVNINVQEVMANPLALAGTIRADVNMTVDEDVTRGSIQGIVSGSPSFEVDFTPLGGPTTNLEVQRAPKAFGLFVYGVVFQTNHVNRCTSLKTFR